MAIVKYTVFDIAFTLYSELIDGLTFFDSKGAAIATRKSMNLLYLLRH
jgi:hypothetical protein